MIFCATLPYGEVFLMTFCSIERVVMILIEDLTVVSQREIAPRIFEMVLKGEMVADMQLGQFVHLKVPDPSKLLRRPISISEIDYNKKEATIVYRVEREGTAILSKMVAGQTIDTMGPQGNGFDISIIEAGQKALLVGGGIGVPPLVETAKQLNAVILEDKLRACGDVYVTTDDGSYGIKGYVSTVIDNFDWTPDAVYSCGAPGMLKYVDSKFENHPHAYVSMEARMACGMGACYACVVHVKGETDAKNLRVCEEGPVFPTGKVIV